MNHRINHHQLPDNLANLQTNFTDLKHKVIDYLRKHNQQETIPLVNTKNYVILNSNSKNIVQNPFLSCNKFKKQHNHTNKISIHQHTHKDTPKLTIIQKQQDNIFQQRQKISSRNNHHFYEEDFIHGPPTVNNLHLDQRETDNHNKYVLATLKKKLQAHRVNNHPKAQKQAQDIDQKRYRSIEIKKDRNEQKIRSKSIKRVEGLYYERAKTSKDYEKNIFTIPISQYIKRQKAIKQRKQIADLVHPQPQIMKKNQQIKQKQQDIFMKTNRQSETETQWVQKYPKVSIYGIQPTKQFRTTHRRFYAHPKENSEHSNKHPQRQTIQKFDFSPWENIKEQATITNFDNIQN